MAYFGAFDGCGKVSPSDYPGRHRCSLPCERLLPTFWRRSRSCIYTPKPQRSHENDHGFVVFVRLKRERSEFYSFFSLVLGTAHIKRPELWQDTYLKCISMYFQEMLTLDWSMLGMVKSIRIRIPINQSWISFRFECFGCQSCWWSLVQFQSGPWIFAGRFWSGADLYGLLLSLCFDRWSQFWWNVGPMAKSKTARFRLLEHWW